MMRYVGVETYVHAYPGGTAVNRWQLPREFRRALPRVPDVFDTGVILNKNCTHLVCVFVTVHVRPYGDRRVVTLASNCRIVC
jgi:hypothetical protein